uniref:Bromo domain-containing protein n=1 Tax=Musa acuminata subsp. malaccensis TaxID=214687 RepID=A0A804IX40_MUSAM|nr:PREDICTED: transcription factor GTE9-like isoform X1 [Musa acuminata subsp. malaccensis]
MVVEGELINIQNAPLQFFELSTMPVAEKLALKKKLKTELDHVRSAVENIIADCERRLGQKHSAAEEDQAVILGNDCAGEVVASIHSFCIPEQQPSLTGENYQTTMSKRKIALEMNTNPKDADNYSNDGIDMIPDKSDAKSVLTGPSKGSTLGTSDALKVKGEKMDSFKTRQCANILKILMIHPAGWVFKEPVDPVKLKIPDYFSIISKPMDLGTIKRKLGRKQYSSTVQFAADVRLTFSNAMRYNPPENEVHVMAKELNNIFNSRWKLLEAEWRNKSTLSSQSVTNTQKKKRLLEKRPDPNSVLRRFIPSAEKLKLKKELSNLPVRKMPPRLLSFLQSKGIVGQIGEFVGIDIDMFDEETLWELHQLVRNFIDGTPIEQIKKCTRRPEQDSHKGPGETVLQSDVIDEFVSPLARMKSAHRTVSCQRSHCNDSSQASSSEVDSGRSSRSEHYSRRSTANSLDWEKTPTGFGLQSNDSIQSISHPPSPLTAATEDLGPCEEQLSPSKALRAAMLKSRFADTILKAQQQSLGVKIDPAKLQREREKLEKRQREEKARIEAQVKAAEIAAKMKAEAELTRQREAARLALQKMEKTVEIDNSHILKDLENLGCPLPGHFDMTDETVGKFMQELEMHSGLVNPLEQLGLFMKNEDLDEVDEWISSAGNGDVEEGEIDGS